MTVKLAPLALALLVCACDRHARKDLTQERQLAAFPTVDAYAPAAAPAAYADGVPARTSDSASTDIVLPGANDVLPNLVIRAGTATMQVDSLDRAVALVHALARRVGGFVGSSTTQSGRGAVAAATLEIRMPADRFEDAVDGLRPIGKVESVNVTAQDVGEEYVDVQARMANDHRLETRLIELVAQRTGKLSDVLAVEQELARVREEIERYQGRLRYLQTRAAVSTLSLTIHMPIPVVDEGSPGVMGEAVRDAWRNFIAVLALLIQSLGVIIPLGVVAGAGWLVVRRFRRPPPTTQTA
ncbi:MAG TPA: DUF4349 domain-containing protein [Gemmatimonadales bacterium]|nr:DUF4349 domain-containing protein [Gemmatimonadales bacterium]